MAKSSTYVVAHAEFVEGLRNYIRTVLLNAANEMSAMEPHGEAASGVFQDAAEAMRDAILLVAEETRLAGTSFLYRQYIQKRLH